MTDLILQKFQTDAVFTTKSISKSKAKVLFLLSVIPFRCSLAEENEQNLDWRCGAYKHLYPIQHGIAVLLSLFGPWPNLYIYIFF